MGVSFSVNAKNTIKLLSVVLVWLPVLLIMTFVDPDSVKSFMGLDIYLPFVTAVFIALVYSCFVILRDWKESFVTSVLVEFYLIWQILRIANLFNLLLVLTWFAYLFLYKKK